MFQVITTCYHLEHLEATAADYLTKTLGSNYSHSWLQVAVMMCMTIIALTAQLWTKVLGSEKKPGLQIPVLTNNLATAQANYQAVQTSVAADLSQEQGNLALNRLVYGAKS